MFMQVGKVTRMEEMNESRLFEKMCYFFPRIPVEIIQHYVTQYAKDEYTCTQLLNRVQDASYGNYTNERVPPSNIEMPIPEMENLNIQQTQMNGRQMPTKKNGTRLDGQRSISTAGFPSNSMTQTTVGAISQTAPVNSGNFQGFNYIYVPYGSPIYNGNNNGILYSPVIQATNNNLLLPVPMDGLMRSVSPNPEATFVHSTSPHATVIVTSDSNSHTSVPSNVPPAVAPNWTLPRGGYILTPQVRPEGNSLLETNSPFSEGCTPTRSPRNERAEVPNIGTQLHVNVEPNENPSHDWIPLQTHPSYSHVTTIPYRLLPSPNSQTTQNGMTMFQERSTPEPVHMQTAPIMTQTPIPLVPTPPVQYYLPIAPSAGVVVPDAKLQTHLHLQRQRFNSLRYELEKAKLQKSKFAEEITKDEEILSVASSQGDDIGQLQRQISLLENECDTLCKEVDQHLKGNALLGEINDDFYSCLNTGQQGPLIPPRPPAELLRRITCRHSRHEYSSDEDEENRESWKCIKCTFANHPAISVCEMCTEPRSSQSART